MPVLTRAASAAAAAASTGTAAAAAQSAQVAQSAQPAQPVQSAQSAEPAQPTIAVTHPPRGPPYAFTHGYKPTLQAKIRNASNHGYGYRGNPPRGRTLRVSNTRWIKAINCVDDKMNKEEKLGEWGLYRSRISGGHRAAAILYCKSKGWLDKSYTDAGKKI